ncbi:aspartyl protease family protein [Sideroxydans lithotrophicus]|uniref:Frataxin family protein n=1 Tax=Sideroxydans lithotrophicus (strain ES-1) TaxID=580332 RepID=D5CMA1_SIDLE|nr:aspartyl protease family protein [Sideroxydans lithotrophicus]ADE10715.1 Frataxin family protein [Sideroxydans lithotrophicus ES-1]
MTESPGNEPGGVLFARIRQMVDEHGVDIRQIQNGNALRLEFADGQRILVNIDPRTHNVWLAARSGGTEFAHRDGTWHAHDQGELMVRLRELIEQTIASNPLNARAPSPRQAALPPSPAASRATRNDRLLRIMLILLPAAAIVFWIVLRLMQPHESGTAPAQMPTLSLNKLHYPCQGALPTNGSIALFPGSNLRTDDPDDPEVILQNEHTHPVLLIFSVLHGTTPSASILVHAGQSSTLHLPPGKYDMMFSVGNTWCNPRSGFSEGHLLKFGKPLTVQIGKPVQLAMRTSGTGMEDFQLFAKAATEMPPPPILNSDGNMEIKRQTDGHFYLPGTVESVPAMFKVDPDTPVTSISSDLALHADIRNCKEVQSLTANGAAAGCIALVPHMTLGDFKLENITVAVIPNLEANLLGANALRNFQVKQNGSSMLIGRHQSGTKHDRK